MQLQWTKYIVISSSVILLAAGIAAFFIPERLALLVNASDTPSIFIQLYGASLIGFGFANWHIRHAAVGGIYGRALVTGNLIHFLSGSGILIGLIAGGQTASIILALGGVYIVMAAGFIAILFSGGLRKES